MATLQRISKETEGKLVRSLDKVASLVREGETPSDAIIKVASDADMPIGQVQLMVQAYNNAGYNQQRKSSSLVAEKAAHFPLADPNHIFEKLYPANVKEAQARSLVNTNEIDAEYNRPPESLEPDRFSMPSYTKVAKVIAPTNKHPREQSYYMKKAHSLLKELDVEHAEKRRLMNAARDKVAEAFDELTDYFKTIGHESFGEVKTACLALYGPEVKPIFDHLADVMPKLEKESPTRYKSAVDRSHAPWSLVENCWLKTSEYLARFNDLGKFSKAAGAATTQILNEFMPLQPVPTRGSLLANREKRADPVSAAGMFAGPMGQISQSVMSHALAQQLMKKFEPAEPEKLERKSLINLMDPAHEQKLRGVRAQATFHDIMANDEFMQGADPTHVTKMYNEIARISPRAVDQPMLMRALLRRYIAQGQTDPHEVEQLAKIEGELKAREEPTEPQPLLPKQE